MMTRRPFSSPRSIALCAALVWCLTGLTRPATALPPRGSDAPPIRLQAIDGTVINTADFAPRTLVIIFGEFGHEGVDRACSDVLDVLKDQRIDAASVVPVLVVAQEGDAESLRKLAALGRYPTTILHDPHRDTFGAYHVLVVPTVVVVDPHAKVTYAMPGFLSRFKEVLTGALLTAGGKMTQEDFDRLADGRGEPKASPEELRAHRLVSLGNQLARHGLVDDAQARFTEAMQIAPENMQARLGLADLLLGQGRRAEAEPLYRSVLVKDAASVDAALGLAAVKLEEGTAEALSDARARLGTVLEKDGKHARARYLLGCVLEKQGDVAAALAEYKRSAELLLEGLKSDE